MSVGIASTGGEAGSCGAAVHGLGYLEGDATAALGARHAVACRLDATKQIEA